MISLAIGLGLNMGGGGFSPLSFFAAGEQGAWYDSSDFSTMFQDRAGTTPVTAVGQPVGMLLDKHTGLAESAELITVAADRDFSSDTGFWSKDAGVTISGGAANWAATAAVFQLFRTLFLTAGKVYDVTYSVTSYTQGGIKLGNGLSGTTRSAVGTYTERLCATTGTLAWASVGASTTLSIDNVSVKEVTGNHLTQSTTTQRPLLQQDAGNFYEQTIDGVDDNEVTVSGGGGTTGFLFCAAVQPSSTGIVRTLWSDTGTNTGYRVRLNAANQLELAAGNGTAYTTATSTDTLASGTSYVVTAWHDGANLKVQVNNGSVVSAAFVTATAGTASFTIGKDNGAASSFYAGKLYPVIYIQNFVSTAQKLASTKTYVGSKAGLSL